MNGTATGQLVATQTATEQLKKNQIKGKLSRTKKKLPIKPSWKSRQTSKLAFAETLQDSPNPKLLTKTCSWSCTPVIFFYSSLLYWEDTDAHWNSNQHVAHSASCCSFMSHGVKPYDTNSEKYHRRFISFCQTVCTQINAMHILATRAYSFKFIVSNTPVQIAPLILCYTMSFFPRQHGPSAEVPVFAIVHPSTVACCHVYGHA